MPRRTNTVLTNGNNFDLVLRLRLGRALGELVQTGLELPPLHVRRALALAVTAHLARWLGWRRRMTGQHFTALDRALDAVETRSCVDVERVGDLGEPELALALAVHVGGRFQREAAQSRVEIQVDVGLRLFTVREETTLIQRFGLSNPISSPPLYSHRNVNCHSFGSAHTNMAP